MIKKVIYRGFKSFADTVEVDFSQGLTTVIGPNGCGKSNIVDGIRWVLGEQSAKSLRGGKMEDIIFHGTNKRKASDSAEVTLVLDNSQKNFKKVDTSQVTVTRRTFRKGGSEYLINGEISKLKTVQNLFLDSGIGSRSYSLIGQEQAKKILSSKVEERRAIFEEAAGIVKYKQQKKQTEERLREIDGNLTRMEDILHELERQINPLKKQSEKAKKHKEITSTLKTLEIQYLLNQYDILHEQISGLKKEIDEFTETVSEMETNLNEGDVHLSELKQKYQDDNEDIFSTQNSLSEIKEEMDRLDNEIALLNERNQHSTSNQKEYSSQLEEMTKKYALSMDEFNHKNNRLEFVLSSFAQLNEELEGLNNQINSVENDKLHLINDYEFTRQKSVDLYNTITQKQYERTQLKEKTKEEKERRLEIEKQLSAIDGEFHQAKDVYEKLNKSYNELNESKNVTNEAVSKKQHLLQDKEKEKASLNEQLNRLMQNEVQIKTKVEQLDSYINSNSAFFDGVKVILNEKKKGKFLGVYGAFAELIKVDKEAETAIDTLLQSTMQAIVTKDDAIAKECIQFLNKGKLGRATFLPVNIASANTFNKDELNKISKAEGIHLSMDSVMSGNEVKPVIESKLGRSLIADTLEIGLAFFKETKIKARIATRQGEIIQSGSITGGTSTKQKTNFFTKTRELEEEKNNLASLESEISQTNERLFCLNEEISALKNEYQELSDLLQSYSDKLVEDYTILKDTENDYNRIHEKHQDLLTEKQEITLLNQDTEKKINQLKFEIEILEKDNQETKDKLESLHSEKENQDGSLSSMLKRMNDTQTTIARLEEEEKQLRDYMDKFGESALEIQSKLKDLETKKQEEELTVQNNTEQLGSLNDKLNAIRIQHEAMKRDISEQRSENQKSTEEMNKLDHDIKILRQEKEQTEKQLHSLNIKYSKRETELKSIINRLLEDYEIIEESIDEFERQNIDMKTAKKEVDSLRKELNALGNINHNATEEYEEISERYETESKQFEDSKIAKEDLLELITNIEEDMTIKFMSTFEEVAKNFEETFVSLFQGGNAKLKLVDEKNPLTSEIEILAQPPGKVAKSISLLSGGEQSLCAVALIFAIILAKPSPFVILDEVDAPLDDSNVARFAKYLKQLSEENQFIVITHRIGTKMVSDYMYGVTHEEPGVSVAALVKLNYNEKIG